MPRFAYPALACLLLAACSSSSGSVVQDRPLDHRDERRLERGSLTGEGGLLSIGRTRDEAAQGSPLGVNSYLWRATLDTLAFLPLASADPFGGVILTDWYEDPKTPGERYKVNAVIMDKTLRADGIKVTVFKQKMQDGSWRDQPVDAEMNRRLEDTILTRARELRIAQLGR